MAQKRRQFSREFKEEAVELASRPDVMIKDVANDLGIHRSVLERWCRASNTAGEDSFPGKCWHRPLESSKRSSGSGVYMSAVGHCGDNAAAEGVFGLLKRDRVRRRRYLTLAEARSDVFDYIERFHNPRMRRRVEQPMDQKRRLTKPSAVVG